MDEVHEVIPEDRPSILQSVKEWFTSLDKFTKLLIIFTILICVSISAIGGTYLSFRQYAQVQENTSLGTTNDGLPELDAAQTAQNLSHSQIITKQKCTKDLDCTNAKHSCATDASGNICHQYNIKVCDRTSGKCIVSSSHNSNASACNLSLCPMGPHLELSVVSNNPS